MHDGNLFDPIEVGGVALPNRVVMAPMTRSRADFDGNVSPMAAEYYSQRASAGLIVTEAIAINRQAHGYPFTPGIWSDAQRADWRTVTESVHAAGGRICAQLWHVGRVFSPKNNPAGLNAVGPSSVAPRFKIFTKEGVEWIGTPRELSRDEVEATIRDFAEAAKAALDAGFDLVEFHGANGYLIEQFLSDEANIRTDEYGGMPRKRLRFLAALLEATKEATGGLSRIGLRLSPFGDFNGILHSDPMRSYSDVLDHISDKELAYLHLVEPSISGDGSRRVASGDAAPDVLAIARERWPGRLIACADYDRSKAEAVIAEGRADLIAFGRPYISNPDLVERMRTGAPLTEYDRSTFYTRGPRGYTDYPALATATS